MNNFNPSKNGEWRMTSGEWWAGSRFLASSFLRVIFTVVGVTKPLSCRYVLRFTFFSLLVLLSTLLFSPVFAQNPLDADVDFYAQPPQNGEPFTVGDRIVLRLEVKHPANSQVNLPQVDEEWGNFEVIEQGSQQTVDNGDGTATTGKDIVVALFEPGQFQTPPLLVTHQKVDGSVEELGAPVIPLHITSVLVEGDDELRDIKDQAEMLVPPLWPLILAGLFLAAVMSGGLFLAGRQAYRRWWPKPAVAHVPEPVYVDTRPPEIIAYAELDRIEALNLPAQNRIKEHYSLVTDCLRHYIENRYNIPALEQTSSEIQIAFRRSQVPSKFVRGFMDMFIRSDLVKFARFRPTPEEAGMLVNEARQIIKTTTPVPEVVTPDSPKTPTPEAVQ